MGIVVGAGFLVFGIAFLVVLLGEGSQIGVAFMALWIAVVTVIIAFNVYHLVTRKAVVEIDADTDAESDFDAKLRKLERLKNDRLISEEEFRRKRAEILEQKW